jgi:ComF family protein
MSLTATTSLLYDAALGLFYPLACAVCGGSVESRADGVACDACWTETRTFTGEEALCWKCGALTPAKVCDNRRETVRCRSCDEEVFTAARACGFYEGALRASVLALKRGPHVPLRLARLMFAAAQRPPLSQTKLIVPVPLHPERLRERGFNQASALARELARATRLPIYERGLQRAVHTEMHRSGMDARARRESVTGAFVVRRPSRFANQAVLLVDDVFTTGATASACAAALKAAGASSVFVLTIARPASYAQA